MEGFPKAHRLRRRSEFIEAQKGGRRIQTAHFVLLLKPRGGEGVRLGVTVSKKVGTAVVRNRLKRLVRETFRRGEVRFPDGHDVVVVAKAGARRLGRQGVRDDLRAAFRARSRAK